MSDLDFTHALTQLADFVERAESLEQVHIPAHREQPFRRNVNTHSGST
jgi:hypothetical protein